MKRVRLKPGYPLFPSLLNIILEGLDKAMRQENELVVLKLKKDKYSYFPITQVILLKELKFDSMAGYKISEKN